VLCPSLVDTPMTDVLKDRIPATSMVQTADLVSALRMLLALSAGCVVPEIAMTPPGGRLESTVPPA
jgi:hypothetical protein